MSIFSTNPGKVTPPTESHKDSEAEIWINNEMMKMSIHVHGIMGLYLPSNASRIQQMVHIADLQVL